MQLCAVAAAWVLHGGCSAPGDLWSSSHGRAQARPVTARWWYPSLVGKALPRRGMGTSTPDLWVGERRRGHDACMRAKRLGRVA